MGSLADARDDNSNSMLEKGIMFADGGARGNPGPAAGAAVLFAVSEGNTPGEVIGEAAEYLGVATNNVAEYTGIIVGLRKARELGIDDLDVRLDSELAVKQLNGQYRVKNPALARLFVDVHTLRSQFRRITFMHVRREFNKHADALVNKTIDAALGL